jgi:hypothetical protein
MADPREHQPKLGALEAYRRQRLTAAGRARVERHLAGCPSCQEALEGMRRYAQISEDALDVPLPAIDWARMELPLQREATRLARGHALRRMAAPLAVAVAAGVVLFLAQQAQQRDSMAMRTSPAVVARVPAATLLPTQVTALIGSVEAIDGQGRSVALDLSSTPSEGWVLRTGAQSELHLALEGTAALIVAPSSELRLSTLRPGKVNLGLTGGQVISHVRKLAEGERYEVSVDDRRVAVRGTRFSVARLEPGLAVQLDEGAVAVLREDGAVTAELRAPASWQDRGAGGLATATPTKALPRPREGAAGAAHWPALEVPTWAHVVQWQIDGSELSGGATLRMRVPPGELEVLALLDDGRRMYGTVRVDALGTHFDPRALKLAAPRGGAEPASRPLDPVAAAAVIHAAEPALQRCYERALRGAPAGGPNVLRLRLRIDLDGRGRVKQVQLVAKEPIPELLGACVRQLATGWQFPRPGGGGITFEAPISFRPAD